MDYRQAITDMMRPAPAGSPNKLHDPWPDMERDIELARAIISRHRDAARTGAAPVVDVTGPDGEAVTVAGWNVDLIHAISEQYPDPDERQFRIVKVMAYLGRGGAI